MLSKIRNCALNLLARREHSKLELQRKLLTKGFNADEIIPVLQVLEQQNLQSDQRFVENYILMRYKRGFGPVRIKAELCERGIDQETIDKFLAEYKSFWTKQVEEVRCKKFGKKIPKDLSEQTKQMRYLYYKGFDTVMIRRFFKEAESG